MWRCARRAARPRRPRRPPDSPGRAAGRTGRRSRRTRRGRQPGCAQASKRSSSSSSRRSASGSSGGPAGAGSGPRTRAPAPGRPAERDGAHQQAADRQQPGQEVEPSLRRRGEHRRTELGDELRLDLALRVTGGDPLADERAQALRHRRRRHVEGRVAGRADHLVLEIGERRMPLARERRHREHERREQERCDQERRELHDRAAARIPSSSSRAEISPATWPVARPSRSMKNVSGNPVTPQWPSEEPGPSARFEYVMPCLETNLRPSLATSCASTPTTTTPWRPPFPPGGLQPRSLLLARVAPGGPEVDDDRLAAERREVELRVAVELPEHEGRRLGLLARLDLVHEALAGLVVDEVPDEQPEQTRDGRERDCLQRPPDHAATTKTGVPTSTWSKSHSACGMSIRMQPWEAE